MMKPMVLPITAASQASGNNSQMSSVPREASAALVMSRVSPGSGKPRFSATKPTMTAA